MGQDRDDIEAGISRIGAGLSRIEAGISRIGTILRQD